MCIQGIYLTILLVMNYATFLDYPNETESLSASFDMIKNGVTVDMKPRNLGGDGG